MTDLNAFGNLVLDAILRTPSKDLKKAITALPPPEVISNLELQWDPTTQEFSLCPKCFHLGYKGNGQIVWRPTLALINTVAIFYCPHCEWIGPADG